MNKYRVKLIDKQVIARDTMAFHLEKPANFDFKAGQYIDLELINPSFSDADGNIRTFSIANTPEEKDIVIATRIRNTAFKQNLKNLKVGEKVEIEGPFGSYSLHEDTSKPTVFIIGGIGITPALSLIKDAFQKKTQLNIHMFYSNRKFEDVSFYDELNKLDQKENGFNLITVLTDERQIDDTDKFEDGRINIDMITKYLKEDLLRSIYYISGPPNMVAVMHKTLKEAGVKNESIRVEEFSGY